MRVVAATPLYPPRSRVGAWLATHSYLAHLTRVGHTVDVHTYMNESPPYVLDGVTVHGMRANLEAAIVGADVVVSHLGDDNRAHDLAVKHRRPSVRMVHGNVIDHPKRLDGAALAVANSEASRAAIGDWSGPIVVCHPVTDLQAHATVPGDRATLVNLAPAKGGDILPLLAAAMPEQQFLGVKGGYGRQKARTAPNIDYLPVVEDMRQVWSQTRVLLMPSLKETWGMAAVEAMCSGIPVIAHPTPGLRESLGDAGIFVDRTDLTGWVVTLRELSDPDRWHAASQAAFARAVELAEQVPDRLARFTEAIEAVAVKGASCV